MKVPDEVFAQICADVDAAEQSGGLDQLFKGEIHPREGPNKEEFLHSFSTGMKLYKSTFLKIYGYELSYPGFSEKALAWLEMLGCSKARAYYSGVVAEYEHQHEKEMRGAAAWYRVQCENDKKEVRQDWNQKEVEQLKADLHQKSDRELLTLLQRLRQSGTSVEIWSLMAGSLGK